MSRDGDMWYSPGHCELAILDAVHCVSGAALLYRTLNGSRDATSRDGHPQRDHFHALTSHGVEQSSKLETIFSRKKDEVRRCNDRFKVQRLVNDAAAQCFVQRFERKCLLADMAER